MLYFLLTVILSCVFECSHLVSATQDIELQSFSTSYPGLEEVRLAFLKARTEYADFYWANKLVIEEYRGVSNRLEEMQSLGGMRPPPQGASAVDQQKFTEKVQTHRLLFKDFGRLASGDAVQKLLNLQSEYEGALAYFANQYAHEHGLSDIAISDMKSDIKSRLGFLVVGSSAW